MVKKIKKTKKSKGQRGTNHYHGARKKWKGSGHHGGVGMAGAGKRADQKKTLVIKLYGHKYFGKQGITSKSTERKKLNVINLEDIQKNLNSLMKKYGKGDKLDLSDYKILGEGELNEGLKIKAMAFSEPAKKKIEKAGGEAIISDDKEKVSEKKIVNKEEIKEKKATKTKIIKSEKQYATHT
jgi:large subunit ribosomal protein L15